MFLTKHSATDKYKKEAGGGVVLTETQLVEIP